MIKWEGGPCPVGKKERVRVQLRNGDVFGFLLAEQLNWRHAGSSYDDIISYEKEAAASSPGVGMKYTNPKDFVGSNKLPLHLWPETATIHGCLAFLDGAGKYGRLNWRAAGVRASIYVDAARRHLNAWFEGEDCAPDSKVHHLGHALACIAVILDAQSAGKLNDDRMIAGGYNQLVDEMTPLVEVIKARHADKSPKHYTIADTTRTEE